MKKIVFKGCGTAIPTPFTDTGINFEELKKLIEFQIKEGADSLIVCGTTGESSTLTIQERNQIIKFTVDTVKNRIPVIAGTGCNNTQTSIQMSKFAEQLGVDALLIVTPYYNKTTQAGLLKHYQAIAYETNLPIIIYNIPSRTGLNISPETCFELSKIQNIVAIKEASGNISQIAKIASLCKENLQIYSGNDDQIIPILSLGGIGVISVLSNIAPKYTHDMIHNFFNGQIDIATSMQLNSINLINNLFSEVNPIPIKEALNILGYNYGIPRLPLVPMSSFNKEKLQNAMTEFSLISK